MTRPTIVITYPYPIGQKAAGGSRTTKEVALHLARAGAHVIVMPVSTNPLSRSFPRKPPRPEEIGAEHDPELTAEGVEVIRPQQDPLLYQLDGRSVRREVKKVMKQRRVDMVLGHFHEAGFLADLCKRNGTVFGFLATWQTYSGLAWQPARLLGRFRKALENRVIVQPHRDADIHFAISDFTRRELIEFIGVRDERIRICPLGTEPTFLEVPRARPDAITNLIFFGRITPSKGFRDAIEALAKLRERGKTDWTYRIYGSGRPEWARAAAEEFGLGDQVKVYEPVDTAGLAKALAWAHLAILPSHFESFGHAMVEAQAAGLPVVAYARGSVPEVVQDGVTGWLAPFQEVDGLTDRIERAIDNPGETYETGLRARERVRKTYTWTETARIILEGLADLQR